ncbi:MAG: MBL fold metallo-hydrolase [Acidobacteriota bacterium]|nr:MBL fold metallo-hydrolase [Acidobacteriota bacterium]
MFSLGVTRRGMAVAVLLMALLAMPTPVGSREPGKSLSNSVNRIVNLYDAFGYEKRGTILDWGFSAFIRYDGKTILFDSGSQADVLAHNARALGVDLRKIDFAVLSHRHADHASGFDYLLKVNPSVKLYLPNDRALGAPEHWRFARPPEAVQVSPEELYWGGKQTTIEYKSSGRFWNAHADWVTAVKEIAPGVFVVPTPGAMLGDFSKYPPNEESPELTGLPELSLALKTTRGAVLIVGCAHSRVEAIVVETKKRLNTNVELLAGGFHLLPYSAEYITELAGKLKNALGVRRIAPAHCTGVQACQIFKRIYGDDYSYAGLEAEISFLP